MIRLIAADMDGTLPETIGLIGELSELGVRFCVGSGRRHDTLRELFAPVASSMDFVCSNGTEAYMGDELVSKETFSVDALERLAEVAARFDCLHLTCGTAERTYCYDEDDEKYRRFLACHGAWTRYTQGRPSPGEQVVLGVCICSNPDAIADLAYVLSCEMGDEFVFQRTGQVAIDFTPRRVTKATALDKIMRCHGISPDEAIAYGDAMNDYDMMRHVGHPVSVGNALYCIVQIAERHIETNVEHGVQRDMARIVADLRAGGDGLIGFDTPPTAMGQGAGITRGKGESIGDADEDADDEAPACSEEGER